MREIEALSEQVRRPCVSPNPNPNLNPNPNPKQAGAKIAELRETTRCQIKIMENPEPGTDCRKVRGFRVRQYGEVVGAHCRPLRTSAHTR